MIELEQALLSHGQKRRQTVYVLSGLGGIGKTQLAVEFARRFKSQFSSVFWLDGSSESSVKRSIAACASRIPEGQIANNSRSFVADGSTDIDAVVKDVMGWLALPENTKWLLVFDNVDRDYDSSGGDAEAYDVTQYFSGADHGSILITTRLARLEQLGPSQQVGKVPRDQAKDILKTWYKGEIDTTDGERLLHELDGLPLAIAQAGAYLQSRRIGIKKYLEYYKVRWNDLMNSSRRDGTSIEAYAGRSIATTWIISYETVREECKGVATLLLLWSMLDNNDLWYGMFAAACKRSAETTRALSRLVGSIATDEFDFHEAMHLLRSYSLIEDVEGLESYTTHLVVHTWAYHYGARQMEPELARAAILAVGWAVPTSSTRDYSAIQRRLLPHAQVCSRRATIGMIVRDNNSTDCKGSEELISLLDASNMLGLLYTDQGKLAEAEAMYSRALQGYEEALGPKHTSTLCIVNNLGNLYTKQGKLREAEAMYSRALQGREEALGPKHTSTLRIVNNLGNLYHDQDKLREAEAMYSRALQGYEEALGPKHTSTLRIVNNLGHLYHNQGKLREAEAICRRALQGYEEALGPKHTLTLNSLHCLAILRTDQGKLAEAEAMYSRALQGREEALGPKHTSTLRIVNNLGNLYRNQGKLREAEAMYSRALQGYEEALGPKHISTLYTVNNLGELYSDQGKLIEAEAMFNRALRGNEDALGPKHTSTLETVLHLSNMYRLQHKLAEAETTARRALNGYEDALGPKHSSTLQAVNNLGRLFADQGKLAEAETMYTRALQGYESLDSVNVSSYTPALNTISNLGELFSKTNQTDKAVAMYTQALSGFAAVQGPSSDICRDLQCRLEALDLAPAESDVPE